MFVPSSEAQREGSERSRTETDVSAAQRQMDPMDWIRCNKCFAHCQVVKRLLFSSCGHLICFVCLSKAQEDVRSSSICIVCHRPNTKLVELNQMMRPEVKRFFRTPWDQSAEFFDQLRKVAEFQQSQRTHMKGRQMVEKLQNATKYVQMLKAELKKSADRERMALIERDQMRAEMERHRVQTQQLERKLAERDKEIQLHLGKLQQLQLLSRGGQTGRGAHPSLNGNTPVIGMSFSECGAMSTPIHAKFIPKMDHGMRVADEVLLHTPSLNESEIAGRIRMPPTPVTFRAPRAYF